MNLTAELKPGVDRSWLQSMYVYILNNYSVFKTCTVNIYEFWRQTNYTLASVRSAFYSKYKWTASKVSLLYLGGENLIMLGWST